MGDEAALFPVSRDTINADRRRGPRTRRSSAILPLHAVHFLRSLEPADVAGLERLVLRIAWNAGAARPGTLSRDDHVYVIRRGRIGFLATAPGGNRLMVAVAERGGVYSTLGQTPAIDAEALENAVVSPIPGAALRRLAERVPQLGVDLAEVLSNRIATLHEIAAGVGQVHVEQRLWARLLLFARHAGAATPEGVEVALALTHAQWGNLIGASRESVTLAFGKLRRTGMIARRDRTIVIPWEHAEEPD